MGLALCAAAPARAGDGAWHFQMATYAWLMGIKGSVSTLPRMPDADIDVNFYDDILGNLNGAPLIARPRERGDVPCRTSRLRTIAVCLTSLIKLS